MIGCVNGIVNHLCLANYIELCMKQNKYDVKIVQAYVLVYAEGFYVMCIFK